MIMIRLFMLIIENLITQLPMTFTDQGFGESQRSAEFTLTVEVNRNRNAPRWFNAPSAPYLISENVFMSDPVAVLTIRDDDIRVSIHS